ncbi:MAG: hypothetical protein ACI8RZ_005750 [Myxococcota bacterium]|jgi:hypothetical protein
MAVLFFLLACNTPTDAERYLAATADPSNPTRCDPIADAWLAGECRTMAAAAVVEGGDVDGGITICGQLTVGDPWRDECYFLVSDRSSASGDQAREICALSGQFEDRCLGHAFGRDGRALLEGVVPGEELVAYRALREKSGEYFAEQQTSSKKLWHMMTEFVASRDFDVPFSAATCGTLPKSICRTGFQTRIRFSIRDSGGFEGDLHGLCGKGRVEVEAAVALGGPRWEADVDEVVQGAWRQFCGR